MADSTTPNPTQIQTQGQTDNLDQTFEQAAQATKQKVHQDPALSQSLATTPAMQDTVVDIEKELLAEIVKNLEENLPIQDQKDLLTKLYQLSQSTRQIQGVYLKYAQSHEANETQKKLDLISQHIQQGNIEGAITVAKGGTHA